MCPTIESPPPMSQIESLHNMAPYFNLNNNRFSIYLEYLFLSYDIFGKKNRHL